MTLLVRNEEDLVRSNIEYHLSRGVDFIIATDNLSTDATAEILHEYEALGVLRYIHEPSDDYSQDLWVTRMARMAADLFAADWVIHVDADEFWWPERQESLPDLFARIPREVDGVRVARSNFVRLLNSDSDGPFYEAMTVRDLQSVNPLNKPLPGKVAHRAKFDVIVKQGNHNFSVDSRNAKIQDADELIIFHYPLRDYSSFAQRIAEGGAAYARNTRLPPNTGNTWRQLFQLLQEGGLYDHFQASCIDNDALESGQREGRYVFDYRLSTYMNELFSRSMKSIEPALPD